MFTNDGVGSRGGSMPAVTVTISEGSNVFIRITDQGGGVAHAAEQKVQPRPKNL